MSVFDGFIQSGVISMQKTITTLPEIKLVGITTRTNNAHIFEANPSTNKIAQTIQQYFHQGLSQKINHRKKPNVTYCAYTDYESDVNGDYTFFIGEEVSSFDNLFDGFTTLIIPVQKYAKFTNGPGPMPGVVIQAWQHIWQMTPEELGGQRGYRTDFELYDERSADHQNVEMDVFIGIR